MVLVKWCFVVVFEVVAGAVLFACLVASVCQVRGHVVVSCVSVSRTLFDVVAESASRIRLRRCPEVVPNVGRLR